MRLFTQVLTESLITQLGVVVQLLTALRTAQPLLQWMLKHMQKMLPHKHTKVNKTQSRNSKVRVLAYAVADGVLEIIMQQPGGYAFWGGLPRAGLCNRSALRKKLANYLLTTFFNDHFLSLLLQSALTADGRPLQDAQLYRWLLSNVYSNNVQRLYSDWLKVKVKKSVEV